MKVALLFFGQPRFLSNKLSSASHHQYIISKYDTDVFVHSWWSKDDTDLVPSSWSQIPSVPYDRFAIKNIRKLYNPVHAVYEPPRSFDVNESLIGKVEFIKSRSDLSNMKSHLYSIKRVGEIFKDYCDPSEYDFIVLSRFDNIITNLADFNGTEPGFYRMQDHPGIADQLFFFSPEYLEFLNVYDRYDELNEKGANNTLELFKKIHFEDTFPGKELKCATINLKLARSCE